ncbi:MULTISPECIES: MGH1-like glycoside hydrolase domain-containing protein [Proteiniphilum]|jgi:putative isomerase|uniref:MGH1-like glycoside hydrolase domain-containing protein n=1 Tax=Proteiniphilum TaxID=294702 RepID=UPI001EEAB298|nr:MULTISPECIES: trehalase family glycosidase [Proteiniphilum]ULB34538.1 glycoside hydrolase [Proteiniphilum propionicum]
MFNNNFLSFLFPILIACFITCKPCSHRAEERKRYQFENIFDIAYTPDSLKNAIGWFTDAGSWMGFTIPEDKKWVNGFCGPFSLDMNRRQWLAKSAVKVSFADFENDVFTPDSTNYYPGEIYLSALSANGRISQTLHFIDASNALLTIVTDKDRTLAFSGDEWNDEMEIETNKNFVVARHHSGEIVLLTFGPDILIKKSENNYKAVCNDANKEAQVVISFFTSDKELAVGLQKSLKILNDKHICLLENEKRWNRYLTKVLRTDMKPEYDRIAVKSIVTLISNWRTHRGGLLHEGVVPSHAVGYFVGFWAWDSWRFAAALAKFNPELARNNIRAMFDYQLPDGMIIDCIYTNPSENNGRNSKPPLACWAVDEIFTNTNDTAFVREMFPQLMAYYNWWYVKRDHDNNGICEYGSSDGTLEAAAWESGMDNAIRFDDTAMLKNIPFDDAWSMDQESVDLNAFLALESKLLKKFAIILGIPFEGEICSDNVANYFFDKRNKFFFDRRLPDGEFIEEYGCEAYATLWTKVATKDQVAQMLPLLEDSTKFSTYIPFPTVAADNPKYNSEGYWRGPVWLDQTYFAIRGLRNYGYSKKADEYTLQVFDRLEGLKDNAPIHENYGTNNGERLKAPHFSWSASHLLMLYDDYGRVLNEDFFYPHLTDFLKKE